MKTNTQNLDFSQLGKNIILLMEGCEVDGTELSRETGLPTSTISRLRTISTDFSPNLSSLLPLAKYFCVTISQLIGEEPLGDDLCGTHNPSTTKKQMIPLLGAEIIIEYIIHQHLTGAPPQIEVDLAISKLSFAYINNGNAMEPLFLDQTILIIDPELKPHNLDYVLVLAKNKKNPVFRQLLIDGDERYIKALNPAFNEFINITSESHTILGVVVQSRKNFR